MSEQSPRSTAGSTSKRSRPSEPVESPDNPAHSRRKLNGAATPALTAISVAPPPGSQWAVAMKQMRDDGHFLDITLVAGGRKIQAHKTVIASFSPYLHGLLTAGLVESSPSCDEVPIGDGSTDGEVVASIVDCFYAGRLSVSASTVTSLIRTANMLQVGVIESAACDFFVESLEPQTAAAALQYVAQLVECGAHARSLHERCMQYMVENFQQCKSTASFLTLPCETLAAVLESDDLPVKEDVVLDATRAWLEHDAHGRTGALRQLASLIRWPLLSAGAQLKLASEPIIRNLDSAQTAQLLLECLPAFAQSGSAATCPRLKRRRGSPVVHRFHAAGTPEAAAAVTIANGGLEARVKDVPVGSGFAHAVCRPIMTAGKHYAEFTRLSNFSNNNFMLGVMRPSYNFDDEDAEYALPYEDSEHCFYDCYDGEIYGKTDTVSTTYDQQGARRGDRIGLLIDLDAGSMTLFKNDERLATIAESGLAAPLVWATTMTSKNDWVRIDTGKVVPE